MYTNDDAVEVLNAVCRGEVKATPHEDPGEVYCGDVHYDLSNGWKVVVFNDCEDWDYVDSVIAPDGTRFECSSDHGAPDECGDWNEPLGNWRPNCAKPYDQGCVHWGDFRQIANRTSNAS